jgi:serine/threonine-protein kinase SRPK3
LIETYIAELEPVEQDREGEYVPLTSKPLKYDYFPLGGEVDFADFDISLGDWGMACWTDKHLCDTIQPYRLRAPEVLIMAKDWDESVDWWNFGCILMQLFRNICLFPGRHPEDGEYDLPWHLAQIEDQFGSFPRELLDRGHPKLVSDMFDENCRVKTYFDGEDYPRTAADFYKLESDEFMQDVVGEEREQFVDFMRMLMKINPKERPGPLQLLGHPWLDALRKD